jgi:hypothetical protein
VVISNDDTLSAEDIALGYKGGWIIESCFRRMKQTGLEVRPMFHWTPRRIEAHVKLCVLALQVQRAAEIRCAQPWARIAHTLGQLKAVRYRSDSRTIVQRTKTTAALAETLKKLGISMPKQILRHSGHNPGAALIFSLAPTRAGTIRWWHAAARRSVGPVACRAGSSVCGIAERGIGTEADRGGAAR